MMMTHIQNIQFIYFIQSILYGYPYNAEYKLYNIFSNIYGTNTPFYTYDWAIMRIFSYTFKFGSFQSMHTSISFFRIISQYYALYAHNAQYNTYKKTKFSIVLLGHYKTDTHNYHNFNDYYKNPYNILYSYQSINS